MKRISWAVAAGLAGWGAIRLTGADRHRSVEAPAATLLSFTPHVAAAALLGAPLLRRANASGTGGGANGADGASAAGLAQVTRGNGAMITAAATGAALAAVVLPRAIARRQPQANGPVLRVLTANMLGGRASAEAIVRLAKIKGADVVFLQELTDAAVTRLKQAGLNDLLPYEMTDVGADSPLSSGIYARYPLTAGLELEPAWPARPVLTARLTLPSGQRAELVCVHPHPPAPMSSRPKLAQWRAELATLPAAGDPPRVLAGDFNATADHGQFRRLLRLGHVDAAAQLGKGLIPTWGPGGRLGLLTIDHVLVDARCAVLAVSVHRLPGSDHRAVYAQFRLPG
jgi:endonuclease/exonuclease/phosphatase (EEP) superfamily protein YafD